MSPSLSLTLILLFYLSLTLGKHHHPSSNNCYMQPTSQSDIQRGENLATTSMPLFSDRFTHLLLLVTLYTHLLSKQNSLVKATLMHTLGFHVKLTKLYFLEYVILYSDQVQSLYSSFLTFKNPAVFEK